MKNVCHNYIFVIFWVDLVLVMWQYQGNINVSDKVNLIYCGQEENKEIGNTK